MKRPAEDQQLSEFFSNGPSSWNGRIGNSGVGEGEGSSDNKQLYVNLMLCYLHWKVVLPKETTSSVPTLPLATTVMMHLLFISDCCQLSYGLEITCCLRQTCNWCVRQQLIQRCGGQAQYQPISN